VFNVKGKYFTLLEATDDGYIEIAKGTYEEVRKLEEKYQEPRDTVYVHTEMFRAYKRGNTSNYGTTENSGQYERSSRYSGRERLQADSTRDNEYLQSSDKESSIKKSDRDYSAVSNRSLLATALESATQNDIEKSKLNEYKSKIEEMDKQSQKLSELRQEIKELSFAKGPEIREKPV